MNKMLDDYLDLDSFYYHRDDFLEAAKIEEDSELFNKLDGLVDESAKEGWKAAQKFIQDMFLEYGDESEKLIEVIRLFTQTDEFKFINFSPNRGGDTQIAGPFSKEEGEKWLDYYSKLHQPKGIFRLS